MHDWRQDVEEPWSTSSWGLYVLGGRLHTKCTQMCVLRTEKYTHFVGHCQGRRKDFFKGGGGGAF